MLEQGIIILAILLCKFLANFTFNSIQILLFKIKDIFLPLNYQNLLN
jgi:hypothetical protein